MGQILEKLRRYERIGVRGSSESLPPLLAVVPACADLEPSLEPPPRAPTLEPSPEAPRELEGDSTLTLGDADAQPIAAAVRPRRRPVAGAPRLPVDALPRVAFAHRLSDAVDVHDELVAALATPFVEVYGWELMAARMSAMVEWLAERHSVLEKVSVGPDGFLDPDALVCAALSFGSDGGHRLRCALRDLIAHLEFDLLNDRRIEDCVGALEGEVAKLRERAALQLERCAETDPAIR